MAAATRTWRQLLRGRLVWLALGGVAALVAGLLPETRSTASAIGVLVFALHLGVVVTTTGVPGDDLEHGALASDLLAGTPATAVVLGAIVASVAALLPALVVAVALAAAKVSGVAGGDALAALAVLLTGLVAMASVAVLLGTVLAGRSAAVPMLLASMAGTLSPASLPLDQYPPAIAAVLRGLWNALPLPHHVVAATQSIGSGGVDATHLAPLVAGAVVAAALAVAILSFRIATGRWS